MIVPADHVLFSGDDGFKDQLNELTIHEAHMRNSIGGLVGATSTVAAIELGLCPETFGGGCAAAAGLSIGSATFFLVEGSVLIGLILAAISALLLFALVRGKEKKPTTYRLGGWLRSWIMLLVAAVVIAAFGSAYPSFKAYLLVFLVVMAALLAMAGIEIVRAGHQGGS